MTHPGATGPGAAGRSTTGRDAVTPLAHRHMPRLIAAPGCLTAQRAGLALLICGLPLRAEPGPRTELRLTGPFKDTTVRRDPQSILALLDELCPGILFSADPDRRAGQQRLICQTMTADVRLREVTHATNHRDLDIAIHLLRDTMLRIERWFDAPPAVPAPDAVVAVVAPLIWRMTLLDRHHRTHLCLGLEGIMSQAAQVSRLPGAETLLGEEAARRFLARLPAGAVISLPEDKRPDWAQALGPVAVPQLRHITPRRKTTILTTPIRHADIPSPPGPEAAGDDPLDAIAEKLRLIRITSQQRRYPGRATPRLPSRLSVIRLLSHVVGALYPRHYGPPGLDVQSADDFVAQRLRAIRHRLAGQLELEWLLHPEAGQPDCRRRARAAADAFLAGLPQIRDLHDTDINAAFLGDPSARSLDEIVLCFPGIAAILRHRIAHSLYGLGAPMLARIMAEHSHSQSGIDIHPGAKIGPACFIDHGTGVVIGETAVIGRNVRIYQQVTLGAKRFESDGEGGLVKGQPRHPVVGDDVVIYAGATILGRIEIGKGAIIGGGVWLTDPVPPGAVVTQAMPSLDGTAS
ncbi:serine O-acetyltransferase [Celeribacter indicus]|uniref:serine O-acetyltransferase n=1 Tax=Celeribacter indicus TaxID=1208324 RepID=A0A0B5E077_9RHOB|nr:hypothetical protein [Celeribacter indicus]AJE46800.1 Serine O-acetyltransferase [Celeribacter indicus]SDW81628.1 serine O-acetyltransferase [Celeribacter indicus]